MEQKIYERQISKLSLAFRVVDEQQIDRHFNTKEQEILYEFEPKSEPKSTLNLPKVFEIIIVYLVCCMVFNVLILIKLGSFDG